jgi:hypothetical protein
MDVFGADDINQAGSVIKDIEISITKNGLIVFQRGFRIPDKIRKKTLFAIVREPFEETPVLNDHKLAGLSVARRRSKAGLLNDFFKDGQRYFFILKFPDGTPVF